MVKLLAWATILGLGASGAYVASTARWLSLPAHAPSTTEDPDGITIVRGTETGGGVMDRARSTWTALTRQASGAVSSWTARGPNPSPRVAPHGSRSSKKR